MKQLIQDQVEQMPDITAGVTLVATGAGGSFLQAVTEWSSIIVTGGNALLVIGGLYLMWIKIKDSRRRDRRAEDSSADNS